MKILTIKYEIKKQENKNKRYLYVKKNTVRRAVKSNST